MREAGCCVCPEGRLAERIGASSHCRCVAPPATPPTLPRPRVPSVGQVPVRPQPSPTCSAGQHRSAGHCCDAGYEWVPARRSCARLDGEPERVADGARPAGATLTSPPSNESSVPDPVVPLETSGTGSAPSVGTLPPLNHVQLGVSPNPSVEDRSAGGAPPGQSPPPLPTGAEPHSSASSPVIGPAILLGLGVATLAAGAVGYAQNQGAIEGQRQAMARNDRSTFDQRAESADGWYAFTLTAYGVGALLVVGSAIWWGVGRVSGATARPRALHIGPAAARGEAGILVSGAF